MWMLILAPILLAILIVLLAYLSLSLMFGWLIERLPERGGGE